MTDYTAHFRVPLPDFEQEPWHAELTDALRALDTAIYDALLSDAEDWANSTAYQIGDVAIDSVTDGQLYTCAVAHTSPASPTTFASFRASNPTYWNTVVIIAQPRGTWTTATTYTKGDFVIDNQRYAQCLVSHVSGVFNTDLAAGKWAVLIDLSTIDQGFNNQSEQSIASAATTNIGSLTQTRVLITGSTGPITSFGSSTNKFKIVRYQNTPTVNHNAASLILLGGANRTMRAGDMQFISSDAAGNWREIAFARADGNPSTNAERGVIKIATTGESTDKTNDTVASTPKAVDALVRTNWFPTGTALVFYQSAAPTGWTKQTTHNDKALRVVSGTGGGSGGTSAFSTVFGKTATDAYTLTVTDIPAHTHGGVTGNDSPVHTHAFGITAPSASGNAILQGGGSNIGNAATTPTASATGNPSVNHTHSISSQGGGGSHSHPMDIRVQYIDVIVATKDA